MAGAPDPYAGRGLLGSTFLAGRMPGGLQGNDRDDEGRAVRSMALELGADAVYRMGGGSLGWIGGARSGGGHGSAMSSMLTPMGDFPQMAPFSPFTTDQWQEVELQALVFKYLITENPVPLDLVKSICQLANRELPAQYMALEQSSQSVAGS